MISYSDCIGCDGHQCTACKWLGPTSLPSAENLIKYKAKPVIRYWCSKCDGLINKYDKFCHNCGWGIDWSEINNEY